MELPPQLAGYRYLRPIDGGSGGYAQVYVYEQDQPRREVAVKVLKARGFGDTGVQDIIDEATAMARLGNHPHIVTVLGAQTSTDGRPCIIMMYCSGQNLLQLVSGGTLDVRRVVRLGIQTADVVQAAHNAGIIHRDIKPANILTDEFNSPRLTDFGIAGRLAGGEDTDDRQFGVSLPWCPPELLDGQPGSVASDVYSLGATLWHLLAGHSPVDVPGHNSLPEIEDRIRHTPPPRIGRADVPDSLERLLSRMLAKRPGDRPASVALVVTELGRIEGQLGGPAASGTSWFVIGPPQAPPPIRPDLADTADRVRRAQGFPPVPAPRPAPPPSVPAGAPVTGGSSPYGLVTALPAHTELRERPQPVPPEPELAPRPSRASWWAWAAAVVVLAAVGVGVFVARPWQGGVPAGPSGVDKTEVAEQNAGGLGDNLPPGVPTVTVTRVDAQTVRFTWEYSNSLETDTYLWRTTGDARTEPADEPTLELTVPVGTTRCIEVKVVRADGSFGTVDWSPKGCVS